MYAVVYRWKVRQGCDDRFVDAWTELTEAIADHCGSLGSRLHSCGDGIYLAYAVWPNRESWDQAKLHTERASVCRGVMAACSETVSPDLHGEVLADRLDIAGFAGPAIR